MYQSNTFRNFLAAQTKQYGSQYESYAQEFERYDDEELVQELSNYTGQMTLYTFGSDGFNEYFNDVQRIIECMKLRQEFQEQLKDDELS